MVSHGFPSADAVENGFNLLGYAQIYVGEPPDCVPDRRAIELVRFYIDRALHGRGLAHTLMEATLAAASPRAQTIWLGVWERNSRAIAFYAKWGLSTLAVMSSRSVAIVRGTASCGERTPTPNEQYAGGVIEE